MSRTKTVVPGRARRRKVLKAMRGARGGRHRLYRSARETLFRALAYAYRDRRAKKREFRKLWIIRINAAARMNGLNYSSLMHGLKRADVSLDRKVLADMAVHDREGFARLAEIAREHLPVPAASA
jgi:large subunit ribosomal protein L20